MKSKDNKHRKGGIRGGAVMRERMLERIKEYEMHPTLCEECGKPLTYKQAIIDKSKFCSRSCSASFHNKQRGCYSPNHHETCAQCGTPLKNPYSTYCSRECAHLAKWNEYKEKVASTGTFNLNEKYHEQNSRRIHRFIEEMTGHKCAICGGTEHNGQPIPLQVHHIDGNPLNNDLSNLQLVCPNCHYFTDTFGHRNGRTTTRHNPHLTKQMAKDLEAYQEYQSHVEHEMYRSRVMMGEEQFATDMTS